jgi:hypothetical protein
MIIYAGVDGTSTEDNDGYKVTFKNSFVNRMSRNELVPFDDTFYHRGPSLFGHETYAQARMAYTWVVTRWKAGLVKAIFLAGYSRGAAAVIEVAYWLKADGIPVECLILFDAVDRSTPGPGGGVGGVIQNTKIGDNVRQAIHPMRDILATRSRVGFGRCGQKAENPAMPFLKQYFFGTHAAIGGTPWLEAVNPWTGEPRDTIWEFPSTIPTAVTLAQDSACAAVVASWTFPQIISAFQQCKARLEKPSDAPHYGPRPDAPRYGPPPRNGQKIHVVQPGDWLSKIAITYYGDMNKWKDIYEVNKGTIGSNPDLIQVGQRLVIP